MADGHDPERTRRVAAKARKSIMHHVQYIPHNYVDKSSTAGESAADREGRDSEGKAKNLHIDEPTRLQMHGVDAAAEDTGGENLGGGPTDHMDAGSGGPHGDKHPSADPDESGEHHEPEDRLHSDPSSEDDSMGNEGEHGEEGASREKDLLQPNLSHAGVHSATVRKLLGAYKRSK